VGSLLVWEALYIFPSLERIGVRGGTLKSLTPILSRKEREKKLRGRVSIRRTAMQVR
jgi:hypothetical protein